MRALLLVLVGCAAPRGPTCATSLGLEDEVRAFAGCTRVASLTIRTAAPLELSALRDLSEVAGDLAIGPTVALDELSLPSLRRVGGAVKISDNAGLQGIYLPALESVNRIEIAGNIALTTLALPRLTTLDQLVLTDNASLEFVQAESLAHLVHPMVFERNPKLPEDQVNTLRSKTASP